MRRIGFGLDSGGFFAVLFEDDTPVKRLPSTKCSTDAMVQGIAWAEREAIPCDTIRVDTRLLTNAAEGRIRHAEPGRR